MRLESEILFSIEAMYMVDFIGVIQLKSIEGILSAKTVQQGNRT